MHLTLESSHGIDAGLRARDDAGDPNGRVVQVLALFRTLLDRLELRAPRSGLTSVAVHDGLSPSDPKDGASLVGPQDLPAAGPKEVAAEAEARALWLRAMAAPDPFRRDALLRDVASAMVVAYGPALRRYCASQMAAGPEADDVAQRTFVLFWEKLCGFEGRSSLRTFLFGIAHNLCRQRRRDGARAAAITANHLHEIGDLLHAEPEVAPDDHVELVERRKRVAAVFGTLDPKDT